MTLQSKYAEFHDAIKLSRQDDAYRQVREKDDLVTSKVTTAFKEEGYRYKKDFIQGSLASHLGVKPLNGDYDIDRAIVIEDDDAPDDPVKPKKIIRDVLKRHGFKEPKIKRPCVTADYQSQNFHIDFPVYKVDEYDNFYIAMGHEGSGEACKEWEDADPEGLREWLNEFFGFTTEERDQCRRVIKYLKRWRDVTYSNETERKKVYSIGLTIMAKETFSPCVSDEGRADDHTAILETVKKIIGSWYFQPLGDDKYDIKVKLPVTPWKDVFAKHCSTVGTLLKSRLERFSESLEEVAELESLDDQCDSLRKLFGEDFPEGDGERYKSESAGMVGASSGA